MIGPFTLTFLVSQSVKDVLQSLVDDGLVQGDKIGSSNCTSFATPLCQRLIRFQSSGAFPHSRAHWSARVDLLCQLCGIIFLRSKPDLPRSKRNTPAARPSSKSYNPNSPKRENPGQHPFVLKCSLIWLPTSPSIVFKGISYSGIRTTGCS